LAAYIGIHNRGVVSGIEHVGFNAHIEESDTDIVVAFACCPHKRCVGLVECVGVCSRFQELLDSVEVVAEDSAAEKSGVDRVVGRLYGNAGDEEDFREPIGPELSGFGESRSGFVKNIKTLFTKLNTICYIVLHRENLITQAPLDLEFHKSVLTRDFTNPLNISSPSGS